MSGSGNYEAAPLLLCLFNRPDRAEALVSKIEDHPMSRIYISVDGPREGVLADARAINEVIRIARRLEKNSTVVWNVFPKNLGNKYALSAAVTWFFSHEPEGIILEDDCIPDPVAFQFFATALDHYRNQPRVFSISGVNPISPMSLGKAAQLSVLFSQFPFIWGWATWADRWSQFDLNINEWSNRDSFWWLLRKLGNPRVSFYWHQKFLSVQLQEVDTWDYQWVFAHLLHNGLTVIPPVSVITNIGLRDISTNPQDPTMSESARTDPMPLSRVHFPRDPKLDTGFEKQLFRKVFRFRQPPRYYLARVASRIYAKLARFSES